MRRDDLLSRGWKILQDPARFRFGTDAILLASFAAEKKFSDGIDLCCGTGIIPFLLADRCENAHLIGVDFDEESVDAARKSVCENGLEHRIEILCDDLRNPSLPIGRFDLVTANPPYHAVGSGRVRDGAENARSEQTCRFADVAACAARCLRFGGRFCFVFKPERMAEAFSVCSRAGIEPKRLRLIFPKFDRDPELILVECKKGAKTGLRIDTPFVLYRSDGEQTEEFRAISRF